MGRPSKLDTNEILKRATQLFWKRGCDAVSTRDLEKAIGLRAPALYRRFRSKDELLARCVDVYVDHVITRRIQNMLEAAEDPIEGLYEFFTSTLEPHGREARLRGCLLANTAAHAEGQVPEVRAAILRGWEIIESALRRQIERAQQSGQLDAALDPQGLSLALLMSMQGLLTLVRAGSADLRPGIDATFELLGGTPAPRNPSRASARETTK